MASEIRIDVERLEEFIEMTHSGPYQHKLLHYLLKSMLNMGGKMARSTNYCSYR